LGSIFSGTTDGSGHVTFTGLAPDVYSVQATADGYFTAAATNFNVVGFVAIGGSSKLLYLRAWPIATIVVRVGREWVAVEGETTLIGPQDPDPRLSEWDRKQLLRDVFSAAGGTHDDWDAYDRAMAEEGRTVVLISPGRMYTNRSR